MACCSRKDLAELWMRQEVVLQGCRMKVFPDQGCRVSTRSVLERHGLAFLGLLVRELGDVAEQVVTLVVRD